MLVLVLLPISCSLIDGIPKQVPTTTAQPTTPLTNGINTLFPKECSDLFFCVLLDFESFTVLKLVLLFEFSFLISIIGFELFPIFIIFFHFIPPKIS